MKTVYTAMKLSGSITTIWQYFKIIFKVSDNTMFVNAAGLTVTNQK